MKTQFAVICPYCGEALDLYFEEDVLGSLVQDCEVCCRPCDVHIERIGKERQVTVALEDA